MQLNREVRIRRFWSPLLYFVAILPPLWLCAMAAAASSDRVFSQSGVGAVALVALLVGAPWWLLVHRFVLSWNRCAVPGWRDHFRLSGPLYAFLVFSIPVLHANRAERFGLGWGVWAIACAVAVPGILISVFDVHMRRSKAGPSA